jgi:vanillate O-demethylase monooxygenase subunit
MGVLQGDTIQCGYHGLTFDRTGACVNSPTQQRIPPGAKVRSYPVVDKWNLVWIWMGDPAAADENAIPFIDNYHNPLWGNTEADALTCECNYQYLTDNLLDPFHVAWVHQSSLATKATENSPLDTKIFEEGIIVSRWVHDQKPPSFYAPLLHFTGNCDRLQHYEARYPSTAINKSIFTPVGTGGRGMAPRNDTFIAISYNFLTPIDENSTRYYWFQQRNTDPKEESITLMIAKGLREIFLEDKNVLEAVHIGMTNKATRNIDLGLDAGALHFRRSLEKLIAQEGDRL